MPKISVVIPTYNRKESLNKLLDSLTKQTFKDFEVIIVDGGSIDGTNELIKEFKQSLDIKFFIQQRKGFVDAVNQALKIAEGEIYLRTDDDVITTLDWLKSIYDTFQSFPQVGGVTGPCITPAEVLSHRDLFLYQEKFKKGNIFWRLLGWIYYNYFMEGQPFAISKRFKCGAFSLGANFPEAAKLNKIIEVDHPESCNFALRTDLIKQVGGFDPAYVETAEFCDVDVSCKIRKLGYKMLFHPKAIIYHYPSKRGFYSERENSFHRMVNFIMFYCRHVKSNLYSQIHFFLYLLFLNGYFFYRFLITRKLKLLNSITGTFLGLAKFYFRYENRKNF